tara:strand:- start:381 stop:1208 length:828 start_codon:yes stop_codon:yes gene_type:complete
MIQIFVPAFNRPDFLDLQARLFDKFLLDDEYQLNVLDDSQEKHITEKMKIVSDHRNIKYYKTPSEWERYSADKSAIPHCRSVQWMFDTIAKEHHRNDMVMIIDHDCFLVSEFCIYDFIKDYPLAGFPQSRGTVEYIGMGLIFLNMPKILEMDDDIKFHSGSVKGEVCDAGGNVHHWLSRNNFPHKRIQLDYGYVDNDIPVDTDPVARYPGRVPHTFNGVDLMSDELDYPIEFFANRRFIHYRAASNWFSQEWQKQDREPSEEKTKVFNDVINTII